MRSPRGPRRLLPALLAALAPLPAPIPRAAAAAPAADGEEGDGSTSEWNQWGGNPARTFAAAVEPVVTAPRVAWRVRLPGDLLAEPVAGGGNLYAVAMRKGEPALLSWRISDGTPQGSRDLGRASGAGALAVWQGNVIYADENGVRGFRHRETSITTCWEDKGGPNLAPALDRGTLYGVKDWVLTLRDASNGKEREPTFQRLASPPVVVHPSSGGYLVAGVVADSVTSMSATNPCAYLLCKGFEGGKSPSPNTQRIGPLAQATTPATSLVLMRIPRAEPGTEGWFCISSTRFRGRDGEFPSAAFGAGTGPGGLCTIKIPPTTWRGAVYGFDPKGDLIAIRSDGKFRVVVGKANLPGGAVPGAATRAKSVAFFGNWAVDLASSRVLWSLPDFHPPGRAYPIADRTLAVPDAEGGITVLTDAAPSAAPATGAGPAPDAAGPPGTPAPGPADPFAPGPAPSGRDGVLLSDGREVEGIAEVSGADSVKVIPAKGDPVVVPPEEAALALREGKVLLCRDEGAVLRIWRRRLHPPLLRSLADHYRLLAQEPLLRECRRLLDEARGWGLPDDRAAELERLVAGRQEVPNSEARAKARAVEEGKWRAEHRARILVATEWCRARGLGTAAAALLGDAERIRPDPSETERLARACLPRDCPWEGAEDAGARWIRWAEVLARVKGVLVPPDRRDPRRYGTGTWSDPGKVLVVRTAHLMLASRCLDPAIVGRCLANGEWSIRVLETLIGPDEVRPWTGEGDLLDVRLHASQDDYMKENLPGGGHAMPWSAGFFSIKEGVSRFFVPDAKEGDALGRGLFHVMSHELTHHFLERRWFGVPEGDGHDPLSRGFWCIEGIARFVEDQVVEMDRRGLRFDDATVPSLDATAQAAKDGWLFKPSEFLDLSQAVFAHLGTKEGRAVRLRNTIQVRLLPPLALFYEQAGATVYFLVNERGDEGRAAFFRYLSNYYRGRKTGPGWLDLGFADAGSFDAAFGEFLKRLR